MVGAPPAPATSAGMRPPLDRAALGSAPSDPNHCTHWEAAASRMPRRPERTRHRITLHAPCDRPIPTSALGGSGRCSCAHVGPPKRPASNGVGDLLVIIKSHSYKWTLVSVICEILKHTTQVVCTFLNHIVWLGKVVKHWSECWYACGLSLIF